MLLDKEVKINLKGCRYIKHYESLGYKIPRKTNGIINYEVPFYIKIKDLSKGSDVKVKCSCDYKGCDKILNITYYNYNKTNHNGKTYCHTHAMKVLNSGKNHSQWDNNKSQEERETGRIYQGYHNFINRVLNRDNFTCQICGSNLSNTLEVHHLDGYSWCKEKRTDETNAITLCHNCHCNFHNMYGKGNNTKKQFLEWINKKDIILETYNDTIPNSRWAYCIETKEIIKNIKDYCKNKNIYNSIIYNCCNNHKILSDKGFHYIWYDEYINMNNQEKDSWLIYRLNNERPKYIICINTLQVFRGAPSAAKWCGLSSPSSIQTICINNKNTAGVHPITKEKLIWKHLGNYLSEFDNSLDKYYELINKGLLII